MQEFSLFLIKDDFVNHYYHKSEILFDFFRKYSFDLANENYRKQFDFITMDIPFTEIYDYLSKYTNLFLHNQKPFLLVESDDLMLNIECNRKEWTFSCSSIHEAESLLFEPLRSFHTSFFVINFNESRYGWLSPIRKEIIL